MKLLQVDKVEEAQSKMERMLKDKDVKTVYKPLLEAFDYILAEDILAKEPVPAFRRSTVDGYAVRAVDTGGASESIPVLLKIVGEVLMGTAATAILHPGECVYVPTGGMVPDSADAVVMVEYCECFSETETAVYQSVAPGKHVVNVGDDMKAGTCVLKKGTKLRPQEIGALAALGIVEVLVYEPWTITIISTGDELVSPKVSPAQGQVRDINTYGIYAQARKLNFTVKEYLVLKDQRPLLKETIQRAMTDSDIVVVSGGSSKGKKDETNSVIDELASEGVFTHGLALKPGKPTILGYDKPTSTMLVGLPGHPTAAMLVFELVIGGLWQKVTGVAPPFPVSAQMAVNLAAAPGRKTCQLVQLQKEPDGVIVAVPIFGRSGLISVLAKADGYILMEENQEGLQQGEAVLVYPI